ncbi:unnamed protein product [Ranitomeya imitator]|uniref:Uncharacterized protein n=1 Tax=Ranitomeya imitator TaxID=111125 RepID=A0ABN9LBB8_9NEOB|nr:unnamed protein product [Ranitomeya imitator]
MTSRSHDSDVTAGPCRTPALGQDRKLPLATERSRECGEERERRRRGGEETIKKVQLSDPIHPFIMKSIKVVERYFKQYALVDQDILENKQCWDKVLSLVPDDILSLI